MFQVQSSSPSCYYPASAAAVPTVPRPVLETVVLTLLMNVTAATAVRISGNAVVVSDAL